MDNSSFLTLEPVPQSQYPGARIPKPAPSLDLQLEFPPLALSVPPQAGASKVWGEAGGWGSLG